MRHRLVTLGLSGLVLAGVIGMTAPVASAAPTAARATYTPSATAPKPLAPQSAAYTYTLSSGGRVRDYRLHVPPAAAGGRPLPLVLNLHGATQNATLQEITSGMDASSDRNGYLVAYPNGTRIATVLDPDPIAGEAQYGWNAGACCGLPITEHIDDVSFLSATIADIAKHTPVDLRRVYVTGMSNGGMMAYTMAAKASDQVAAISSVAGQVQLPYIRPRRPVPTMELHSVDDPIAMWNGVANPDPRLRFSVLSGINQWVRADGCRPFPHRSPTIRGAAGSISEGLTATLITYRPCRGGAQVALWQLTGSGHVWPGSPLNTGPPATWLLDGVGRGTLLVDANEQMWQFFRRFSLPWRR